MFEWVELEPITATSSLKTYTGITPGNKYLGYGYDRDAFTFYGEDDTVLGSAGNSPNWHKDYPLNPPEGTVKIEVKCYGGQGWLKRWVPKSINMESRIVAVEDSVAEIAPKVERMESVVVDDFSQYSLLGAGYEIVGGKCLRDNGAIENNRDFSIVWIPIDITGSNNMYFVFRGNDRNSCYKDPYYSHVIWADENKNYLGLLVGQIGVIVDEANGGYINFASVKANESLQGLRYMGVSIHNEWLDEVAFFHADFVPQISTSKISGSVGDLDMFIRQSAKNIIVDYGLAAEASLSDLAYYGSSSNSYGGTGTEDFLEYEQIPSLKDLGIARCINFPAGTGVRPYSSEAPLHRIKIAQQDIEVKASQLKVAVVVGVADEQKNSLLDINVTAVTRPNQDLAYESNRNKKYIKKLDDDLYMLVFYLTVSGGYTETLRGREFVTRSIEVSITFNQVDVPITIHGKGFVMPTAWNHNKVRDYTDFDIADKIDTSCDIKARATLDLKQDWFWKGKSVLAVGTSYMHHNSGLAERAKNKLHFILKNNGNVGGRTAGIVGARESVSGQTPTDWLIGMSLTNEELQCAADLGITNGSWMGTAVLGYENLIMRYICGDDGYTDSLGNVLHRPDGYPQPKVMIVLDGQNDSHTDAEPTKSGGVWDRSTWRGAWNYILEEIYKVNPELKVIFLSNPGIVAATGYEGLGIYENTKRLVEYWNLPYVDFVSQMGVVNDYRKGDISIYLRDWGGNHYQGRCAERMAQILAGYLNGIIF